jgi:hypothetical protein
MDRYHLTPACTRGRCVDKGWLALPLPAPAPSAAEIQYYTLWEIPIYARAGYVQALGPEVTQGMVLRFNHLSSLHAAVFGRECLGLCAQHAC